MQVGGALILALSVQGSGHVKMQQCITCGVRKGRVGAVESHSALVGSNKLLVGQFSISFSPLYWRVYSVAASQWLSY